MNRRVLLSLLLLLAGALITPACKSGGSGKPKTGLFAPPDMNAEVHPYAQAVAPHMAIRGQLEDQQVRISRSRNGQDLGEDKIVNTDGNTQINRHNAREWIQRLKADGRPYIMWSQELAQTSTSIPQEYL